MQFRSSHVGRIPAVGATRFDPAPHVVAAAHGSDTALLDMRSERYYTLDAVGSRIWALLASGYAVAEITSRIGEEFDASMTKIETDLRALLDRLEGASLIERAGEGQPRYAKGDRALSANARDAWRERDRRTIGGGDGGVR